MGSMEPPFCRQIEDQPAHGMHCVFSRNISDLILKGTPIKLYVSGQL